MSIGETLKKLRAEKKVSLQKVADAVGTSKPYIWELESGKVQNPGADILYKLAEYYGCSVDHLVSKHGETDIKSPEIAFFREFNSLSSQDQALIKNIIKQLKEKDKLADAI